MPTATRPYRLSRRPNSIQSSLVPTGQPFTLLCQSLARPRNHGRVDLHLHTTFSDGTYTPAQVIDLARRSGLSAIAITDHDTLAGIAPAIDGGKRGTRSDQRRRDHGGFSWPGVASTWIFLRPDELRPAERSRSSTNSNAQPDFIEMVKRLHRLGVRIDDAEVANLGEETTLGRRHLAELMVQTKQAATVRDAFQRYLGDQGRATVPKTRLPVNDAIALVREAAGVASWAHPSYDCTKETLGELKRLGLGAIEAEYPAFRPTRIRKLRQMAAELGLVVTGGSDCHGPDQLNRSIGVSGITHDELMRLREMI